MHIPLSIATPNQTQKHNLLGGLTLVLMRSFNATLHGEPETVTVVMTQTPHSMQHVIIFTVLFGLPTQHIGPSGCIALSG